MGQSDVELSSSKTAGILGPIKSGDIVMIGSVQFQDPLLQPLFLAPPTDCTEPIPLQPLAFIGLGAGNPVDIDAIATYRIEKTSEDPSGALKVSFVGTDPGKSLTTTKVNGNNILIEGSPPKAFTLEQSSFASWRTPGSDIVALSFINYIFSVEDGPVTFCQPFTCVKGGVSPCAPLSFKFFLAPITWFTDCPDAKSVSTKIASVCAATCAAQSLQTGTAPKNLACGSEKSGVGPCGTVPILGYTDATDCKNNFRYTYCPAGTTCMGTCQSACPDPQQVCTFQPRGSSIAGVGSAGGVYRCIGGTGSPTGPRRCFSNIDCRDGDQQCIGGFCTGAGPPTPKEEEILIIIGIVVGLLFLGLVIYMIFAFSGSKKS